MEKQPRAKCHTVCRNVCAAKATALSIEKNGARNVKGCIRDFICFQARLRTLHTLALFDYLFLKSSSKFLYLKTNTKRSLFDILHVFQRTILSNRENLYFLFSRMHENTFTSAFLHKQTLCLYKIVQEKKEEGDYIGAMFYKGRTGCTREKDGRQEHCWWRRQIEMYRNVRLRRIARAATISDCFAGGDDNDDAGGGEQMRIRALANSHVGRRNWSSWLAVSP